MSIAFNFRSGNYGRMVKAETPPGAPKRSLRESRAAAPTAPRERKAPFPGLRLRELIKAQRTTQKAVAEQAGIAAPQLNRFLGDNKESRDIKLYGHAWPIARALQCHVGELFDDGAMLAHTDAERRILTVLRRLSLPMRTQALMNIEQLEKMESEARDRLPKAGDPKSVEGRPSRPEGKLVS